MPDRKFAGEAERKAAGRKPAESGVLAAGTSFHFRHSVAVSAGPERIWALWRDVAHWNRWDLGLIASRLDGDFAQGARGELVANRGQTARFTIVSVTSSSYAFDTRLPLATLRVERRLAGASPVIVTHEVRFMGPLGRIWALILGGGFRRALPPTMAALAALAEGS